MSFLVELSENAYPKDALRGLEATSEFRLNNARRMMWMSQLAYETANKSKVKRILESWHLETRAFVSNDPITGLPPHSACVVVAGGRGATIVAFAGTDPLKIEDWITDFTIDPPSVTDLHSGFEAAVETVWPKIRGVIENRPPSEQALFFTGHSLGGALTIIAAERAMQKAKATAVYTFGSPRTGGIAFFSSYTPQLGDCTFRLVHGTDVVATVPPSLGGQFRHVGRAIQCPTDGVFDAQPQIQSRDGNEPDLAASVVESALADFRALAFFRFIRRIGPRPLDRLSGLLPRMVRDHVPGNYFRALLITLK